MLPKSAFDPKNANATHFSHGHLEAIEQFVCVCDLMKEMLWPTGKKFRVTIECDPENGDYVMKREPIDP